MFEARAVLKSFDLNIVLIHINCCKFIIGFLHFFAMFMKLLTCNFFETKTFYEFKNLPQLTNDQKVAKACITRQKF